MFCPKCGQQQVSDEVRFCSRCGFQLDVVKTLLAGENFPALGPVNTQTAAGGGESPRKRGVKQGLMLMMSTVLIVPLVVFLVRLGILQREFIPLAAIICAIGGFLRLIYALLFQEGASTATPQMPPAYVPPVQQFGASSSARAAALPPASARPATAPDYRGRLFDTSELGQAARQPPSVTESETKMLDEK
jgi:hypothetical protein